MVFDKTGTLTEDGLQVLGARAINGDIDGPSTKFDDFEEDLTRRVPIDLQESIMNKKLILNEAMASCHSITYINKELLGDPLDIKMFEVTDWDLDECNDVSNPLANDNDLVLAYVRPQV